MDPTAPAPRSRRPLEAAASAIRGGPWRLLAVATLTFILGWGASLLWSGAAALRLTEQLSGTVSVVSEDGSKFCLETTGGGPQRCGVAYQRRDAPPLRVGDRVAIGVGRLKVGDGAEEEIMIVTVEQSTGRASSLPDSDLRRRPRSRDARPA